jgi:hypothetical protein
MGNKFVLFTIAVLGSILSYIIIDTWIVSMNIWSYLLIEIIISSSHELYNSKKKKLLNS